jgi:hypothetical protein
LSETTALAAPIENILGAPRVGRARDRGPLRLTKTQREALVALFHVKYRPAPVIAREPQHDIAGMHGILNTEIQKMPEFKKAHAAVRALTAAVVAKYEVESANINVSSMGMMMIAHETNTHTSTYSNDLVNVVRRNRNAEATIANTKLGDGIAKELSAWTLEQKEKLNVIACADNINQVLALVPEVRVNLPTEFDRSLNKDYQQGQLQAGTVIDV